MISKFLQEKENQEVVTYVLIFLMIFTILIYRFGLDFDFKQPEIVPEKRENFLEIRTTLYGIRTRHNLPRFRSFTPIPPFDGISGRTDPFHADGIENINALPATERTEDDEVVAD